MQIAAAVTETWQDRSANELQHGTRDYLIKNPALLVVDEALNVGLPALLSLRWIAGLNSPGVALMLIGAGLNSCIEKEQQLNSRVDRRILLTRQPRALMIAHLRDYHPVIATMGDELPSRIHEVEPEGGTSHLLRVPGSPWVRLRRRRRRR